MDFIKKNAYMIAGIVCVVLLGSLYMWHYLRPTAVLSPVVESITLYDATQEEPVSPTVTAEAQTIKIYIIGEVMAPGLYELNEGDRIQDAVEAAGGYKIDADLTRINPAVRIEDEMKIIIPHKDDLETTELITQASSPVIGSSSGLININTATQSELETLPGIGPAIAKNIMDYRAENGPFSTIDDIKKVSRIGDATFDKIKDKITVN